MIDHGFISLSRKLVAGDDPWWASAEPFDRRSAWIDLLFLAQWGRNKVPLGGSVITLERGEFVASIRFLAERWRWSTKAVRGWLEQAVRIERIRAQRRAHEGAHAPTVYLIVNYSTYQTRGTRGGTRKDQTRAHVRAHEGHTKGTKQKKEERNKNLSPVFEEAWMAYPKRPNNVKAAAWRAWSARVGEGVAESAMLAGTRSYAAYVQREGTAPRFVKQAATFYGPDQHFAADYGHTAQPIQVYDPVTGDMTPEFARAAGMR